MINLYYSINIRDRWTPKYYENDVDVRNILHEYRFITLNPYLYQLAVL